MTTDLYYLLLSVGLTFILIMIPAGNALRLNGGEAQAGPRDNLPEPTVFYKRAKRLSDNMLENMILFTPLVLIAHMSGEAGPLSALGAQIFFYARIAHAIIYLAAWPVVRPIAWLLGSIGMGFIVAELF